MPPQPPTMNNNIKVGLCMFAAVICFWVGYLSTATP
jgi:hypothetical protein